MGNKYKKGAFIISIVLFVISLPFTVMGIIFHRDLVGANNKNHEFHYKDRLYFYDKSGKLINMYNCKYSNCGYAKETIEDDNYAINYFKLAMDTDKKINDRYALIADYSDTQKEVIIYDIKNNKELGKYAGYKIYNVGIDKNYIIVKSSSNLYGVIEIKDGVIQAVIPFEYKFIGLTSKNTNSKISSDKFVVLKDNTWSIITKDSTLASNITSPIVDYNDSSLIVKNQSDKYSLLSLAGTPKLTGEYKKMSYISKYLEVVDTNNNYYILDSSTLVRVSNSYTVTDESVISSKITTDGINIVIDNETKEIVEI